MPNFNSDFITEFIRQLGRFFRQLSKPTKASIVAVLVLMTYWFLSIYFIDRHFYDAHPKWIVVLFCFIISISWLVANIILLAIGFAIISPALHHSGIDTSTKDEELIIFGWLNSIVYLTIILFIAYFNHFKFLQFLIWSAGYPIVALLLIWVAFIFINKEKK